MKVVLFCGGLGLRMRSTVDSAPKPMMTVGDRPVLWHIMRYYAHFGHTEFILCLGYGAASVKQYFLNYDETHSNDFVLSKGGREIELLQSDISEWRISFIDTGINTSIGERLRRVRHLLDDDEVFLANYGDVLTDAPMDRIVDDFMASDAVASLLAVPPQASFHVVGIDGTDRVDGLTSVATMPMWINGGYFVLRQGVFDVLHQDEDLVERCVRPARRAAQAHGRALPRILGPDGHPQGAQPPGGPRPQRPGAVEAVVQARGPEGRGARRRREVGRAEFAAAAAER